MAILAQYCKYLFFQKRIGLKNLSKILLGYGLDRTEIGLLFLLIGIRLNCSTSIDEITTTYGYGQLDAYGFWQFPAYEVGRPDVQGNYVPEHKYAKVRLSKGVYRFLREKEKEDYLI